MARFTRNSTKSRSPTADAAIFARTGRLPTDACRPVVATFATTNVAKIAVGTG